MRETAVLPLRALVRVLLCYGALEIVSVIIIILLYYHFRSKI